MPGVRLGTYAVCVTLFFMRKARENLLDIFMYLWLNDRVVRTLSRMLLVVVILLLLPVMMAGASYGLPGAGCAFPSCCALHHCCAHELQGGLEHGKCAEHEHRHHYQERMQLMRENARRADFNAPLAVVEPAEWTASPVNVRHVPYERISPVGLPPLYSGYLRPQRC